MTGPILVFGADGQTGNELIALASRRKIAAVGLPLAEADITQAGDVRAAIERHRPRLVVNAAAYTAVDRAESEPELAYAANVEGPAILATACARAGVPLVHLSTDYVFDGKKSGAYVENDPIASRAGAAPRRGRERFRHLSFRRHRADVLARLRDRNRRAPTAFHRTQSAHRRDHDGRIPDTGSAAGELRPRHSRFRAVFGYSARPWQERVAESVDLLLRSARDAAR